MTDRPFQKMPDWRELTRRIPGSTTALTIITALVVIVALAVTIRIDEVSGTDVGLLVNNITGHVEVVTTGKKIYNGLYNTFYVMDKTEQKLEMTRDRNDRVRVKTTDGSDVNIDLIIQYRIDPEMAVTVARDSGLEPRGPDDWYKVKWARDYARSICRTIYGELTTEDFYNTALRNQKADESQRRLNEALNPHGIIVTSVLAGDFNFYEEYEIKIQEKKLADQSVEEQQSRANAALQDQIRQTVEATKIKEVALAEFEGRMRERIVTAEAEAQRLVRGAEAYEIQIRAEAEAEYYTREKNAEIITATKHAEAVGIEKMAEALIGEGGLNIVKMEYARRLRDLFISGQPFTREGHAQRFEHIAEGNKATESQASQPAREGASAALSHDGE